ncbi:PxKF domain-containing protein [Knoellia locipacati]|uniref:PxKF domain-containing protein n=1 Tax=Knoellia locipacati TaxID=882824 RepID=UPI0038506195
MTMLRRTSAVAIAAVTLALGAASATADDISNNLDVSVDPAAEVMPLTVGGASGSTTLRVVETNGDGKNGCNLTGSTTLTVSVSALNPGRATVSPSSLTFTSCGDTKVVTVTPVSAGSTTVSLTATSNTTAGTFDLAPASFRVDVTAATPTNTAPTVDVIDVVAGTAYEVGAVPRARCSVVDAEDGPSTFNAELSAVTGPLAASGLGLQTATCDYTDDGDLNAVSSVTYSIVDNTAPVITLVSRLPEANGAGWNNSAVTVTWSCTDNGEIDAAASITSVPLGHGADQSATGTCTDVAGNAASNTVEDINVDTVAPTITADLDPAAANGWWNIGTGAPTVTYSCEDDLSGVDSCTAPRTFGEGVDQEDTGTVTDMAGNTASAKVTNVDVDLTAPVITRVSRLPAANGAGWNSSDVTVTWSCADLRGIDASRSTTTVTRGEGADQSATGTCTDVPGNSASDTVTGINVDKTNPTISAALTPVRPGTGWWNLTSGAPTVTYTCGDSGSGVVECPAAHLFGEGADQEHSGTVFDVAGNSASAGVSDVYVDLTGPGVSWVGGPAAGASYYFGSVPAEGSCVATDDLSGPGACAISGYATTTGSQTMTATAGDVAGNTTALTRSYSVLAWTLRGFYQPVDMAGVVNTVKNGSTVPLKFEVFAGATELTDPSIVDSFVVKQVTCGTSTITDDIELVTTGGTTLRYDATGGQFVQNWQTPKTPGSCYMVTMTTDDGSKISANFKLK